MMKIPQRSNVSRINEAFDAVIGGFDVSISFERVTTYEHDAHYGADADGNRGVPMTFIADDEAKDIRVEFDSDPVALDDLVQKWPGSHMRMGVDLRHEVIAAIDAYLASHPPEAEERDYDGPDTWDEYRGER